MTKSANELVKEYSSLVKRIAYHVSTKLPDSVLVEDLIQSGMIGLLEAHKSYKDDQGASFDTFASIRIRGAMMDEIRRCDWVPRSVYKKSRDVANAIYKIEADTLSEARPADIMQYLGISSEEYNKILHDSSKTKIVSIDSLSDDMSADMSDPPSSLNLKEFEKELSEAIETLSDRERYVLHLYYDEDYNLSKIGDILNISESRVSQINSEIVIKLRKKLIGKI
jgi:RNA polymerase sigma factor for flagellar operon FliA